MQWPCTSSPGEVVWHHRGCRLCAGWAHTAPSCVGLHKPLNVSVPSFLIGKMQDRDGWRGAWGLVGGVREGGLWEAAASRRLIPAPYSWADCGVLQTSPDTGGDGIPSTGPWRHQP